VEQLAKIDKIILRNRRVWLMINRDFPPKSPLNAAVERAKTLAGANSSKFIKNPGRARTIYRNTSL